MNPKVKKPDNYKLRVILARRKAIIAVAEFRRKKLLEKTATKKKHPDIPMHFRIGP